jgi:hypothetical protein
MRAFADLTTLTRMDGGSMLAAVDPCVWLDIPAA